jgi:dTDP-glucose pyrophosphorylase
MDVKLLDAMSLIDKNSKGILFVVDEAMHLLGCVTDGDVRRSIIADGDLNKPVYMLMKKNPVTISSDERWTSSKWRKYPGITALPVVDADNVLLDIKFRNADTDGIGTKQREILSGTDVIIMAGGKGTRLYPYTKILPKPLIPIGDIPILERIMNRFYEYDLTEFYVTVNYKKEMIRSYFSESNIPYHIQYVEEDKPLGTAGSIKLIEKRFTQPVIITNCDILIDADYSEIYKTHIESKSAMTIVTALKHMEIPYGVINASEGGVITSMEEKPNHFYFVNTGMYILNPEFIDLIPDDTFYHMPQLAEKLMEKGEKVIMYPIGEDAFLDMGELEEMKRMEEKLCID